MNTSEVLNRAADGIEVFGHFKGSGYGDGPVETAPACTIGAINRATWDAADNEDRDAAQRAQRAMRDYLPSLLGIVLWNDAPERTASEVTEALRAAALIEEARESSRESAPATERESVSSR